MQTGTCPDFGKLELYHQGKIADDELFAIENHLATCELCSDYIEGLEQLTNYKSLDSIEQELKESIHQLLNKEKQKNRFLIINKRWIAAASLLLIIGISTYIYFIIQKPQQTLSKLDIPKEIKAKEQKNKDTITNQNKPIAQLFKSSIKQEETRPKKTDAIVENETNKLTSENSNLKGRSYSNEVAPSVDYISKSDKDEKETEPLQVAEEEPKLKVSTNTWISKDERIITGLIKDFNTGEPLPGINIIIKGTTSGVVTDVNGKFAITVPNDKTILAISFIGYKSQEIELKPKDTDLNVAMATDVSKLDEVVVVGYGTQKKSITRAISSIFKEKLNPS